MKFSDKTYSCLRSMKAIRIRCSIWFPKHYFRTNQCSHITRGITFITLEAIWVYKHLQSLVPTGDFGSRHILSANEKYLDKRSNPFLNSVQMMKFFLHCSGKHTVRTCIH